MTTGPSQATNCPSCGAPVTLDPGTGFLVCDHCGTRQAPQTLAEPVERRAPTKFACPICAIPLEKGQLGGFELLSCPKCGGMLVAMFQFVSVIEAMRGAEPAFTPVTLPRQQEPDERRIACPGCGKTMLSHIYGGPGNVVIESCEECLVNWLDSGEIRRIARAR